MSVRLSHIVLGLVLLASSSCANRKTSDPDIVLSFKQSACFGTCPIYVMTIDENGHVRYEGERFVDKVGVYTKDLSQDEQKELFKYLKDFEWELFKDEYRTQVTDLPSIIVHYRTKKVDKKITITGEHPKELDVLTQKIQAIANHKDGWINQNLR